MPRLDPEIAQLARYIDLESHEQLGKTAIADDEERRQAVSDFIKQRLHQESKSKETPRQRRLRKSAMQECLEAITKREENCYCPKTLVLTSIKKSKGLCTACERARDALKFWLEVERLLNDRLKIQRDYFTAICNAHKEAVRPQAPADLPALEPSTVVAAIEASRAMEDDKNARNAAKKTA